MKQKILIILSSLLILTNINLAQSRCFVWTDDFGNEQNAKIRSLRAQERYYNIQYQILNKSKTTDRDVVLLRQAANQARLAQLSELQIVRNKHFTREQNNPRVFTRISN